MKSKSKTTHEEMQIQLMRSAGIKRATAKDWISDFIGLKLLGELENSFEDLTILITDEDFGF